VSPERIRGSGNIPSQDVGISPIVLGTWFALLAGLGDVLLYFVTSVLMQRYMHLSPQLVWISPASNVLLFALPGLVLWTLAAWRPAKYWLFAEASVFAFLTAWGLSMYATRVHPIAALVLAVGIAVQTARLITAHPRGTRRIVRYTLPMMAAFVILGGLGLNGWDRIRERRAVAALPSAAQGAPNLLLIILDTVRATSLSLYGYSRRTSPALERFARRGTVFDRAISAAPWTLPSHATLFTGRWPHELNANWRAPLDATYPTLAEVLAQRGYATAGFIANNDYASRESGLSRGFQHYDDLRLSAGRVLLGSALGRFLTDRLQLPRLFGYYDQIGRKRARDVNAEMLDWLAHRDGRKRPYFVFLNYYDAHDPYIASAPYDTLFDTELVPSRPGIDPDSPLTEPDILREIAAYDESLAELDHQLGLLLDQLDRRGSLRNTIVVITSDHGEELGEHGLLRHGKSLYMQELQVPLLISFDGRVPRDARVREAVTLRDIPATVLDLARGANDGARPSAPLPGSSLVRYWSSEATAGDSADVVISEVRYNPTRPLREPASRGDMASIVDGTWHLIRGGDGTIELYQIAADPAEKRNLASGSDTRDDIGRLAARLRALVPTSRRH
jgi:arylsulfatase A-like enzyme